MVKGPETSIPKFGPWLTPQNVLDFQFSGQYLNLPLISNRILLYLQTEKVSNGSVWKEIVSWLINENKIAKFLKTINASNAYVKLWWNDLSIIIWPVRTIFLKIQITKHAKNWNPFGLSHRTCKKVVSRFLLRPAYKISHQFKLEVHSSNIKNET